MQIKTCLAPKHWQELQPHPLSALTEFGVGANLEQMAEFLQNHGYDQHEPIVLWEGQILDGRLRHAACVIAGVTPTFARFDGKSAGAYVAKKLHRQHLTPSQLAMLAAAATNLLPAGDSVGCPTTSHHVGSLSQGEAALATGVSRDSVNKAAKITDRGTDVLKNAVKKGDLTVNAAAKIADLPPEEQQAEVAKVISETKAKPKKRDQGKEVFSWRDFNGWVGNLARVFDRFAKSKGFTITDKKIQGLPEYREYHQALENVLKASKALHKKLESK